MDATANTDGDGDGDEGRYFLQLKNGGEEFRTQNPDGTFRRPFCPQRKKQNYPKNEILQHATGVGSSSSRTLSQSASHRALCSFLQVPLEPNTDIQPPPSKDGGDNDREDERFVYPWAGVLANVPTRAELGSGRQVGGSGSKLRDQLTRFCPVHVRPVWTYLGHSSFALVEFTKDWKGFRDAMAFHRHYEVSGLGKSAWFKGKGSRKGDDEMVIYGWIARADDFNSDGPVGQQLRKKGELLTVDELSTGVTRKKGQLVAKLEEQIVERDRHVEALKVKYDEQSSCLEKMMGERKKTLDAYNLEVQKLRNLASNHSRKIIEDNAKLRLDLETKSNQLDALVMQTNMKRKTLDDQCQLKSKMISLQNAALEQKKADGNVMELLKVHKREKETAFEKILQLERQLDMKQQLELEIEQLKGRVQIVAHMGGESEAELKDKVSKLNEELQEKIEEMEYLDSIYQPLVIKEKSSREELQEARKELTLVLSNMVTNVNSKIQVKMMGALDKKPFLHACKESKIFLDHDVEAAKIHSMWQEEIKKVEWRPFKVVIVDGKSQDVIDEDDPKLKQLRAELGDEVHEAVCTALLEVNSVDGRYVSPEIWNKCGRKATLDEALHVLIDKWRTARRR